MLHSFKKTNYDNTFITFEKNSVIFNTESTECFEDDTNTTKEKCPEEIFKILDKDTSFLVLRTKTIFKENRYFEKKYESDYNIRKILLFEVEFKEKKVWIKGKEN